MTANDDLLREVLQKVTEYMDGGDECMLTYVGTIHYILVSKTTLGNQKLETS